MKKIIFPIVTLLLITSCESSPEEKEIIKATPIDVKYAETAKKNVTDTYFGNEVIDPYRWLEDDMSEETGAWVKAQNEVTFDYLDQIPYREELKKRLEKNVNYERISAPFDEGNYTY
ncbi:MAG: S9 family peptidase, partial [Crocinitomicaceae bacterium]